MIITTPEQRKALIDGGKRLGEVLLAVSNKVAHGVSVEDLDDLAEQMIRDGGDTPAFLGYTPEGSGRPYPSTLCVSVNDEVVHGIPNEDPRTLQQGDIVSLDLGLVHDGIIVDSAITVPVGNADAKSMALIRAADEALDAGIAAAIVGNHIGDIGYAIQKVFKKAGVSVVHELGGHGVGKHVHEDPFVPNFGKAGDGEELIDGMVLALEPIATAGKGSVTLAPDGYTFRTKDGSRASHSEHTILIEKEGTIVVTSRE